MELFVRHEDLYERCSLVEIYHVTAVQLPLSVEFLVNFSQFLLNLDCESICDPPGGDALLAQVIYLTDYLH